MPQWERHNKEKGEVRKKPSAGLSSGRKEESHCRKLQGPRLRAREGKPTEDF